MIKSIWHHSVSFLPFYKWSLVFFEVEFASNYRILHNVYTNMRQWTPVWKSMEISCVYISGGYAELFYWLQMQKLKTFHSWLMKNTTGWTYSEPDVGMWFTAKHFQRMGPDYLSPLGVGVGVEAVFVDVQLARAVEGWKKRCKYY